MGRRGEPPFLNISGRARRQPFARPSWVILGVLFVVLFLFSTLGKDIYTDWLWFDSLGYASVYTTMLAARSAPFVVGALVFFALAAINILVARRFSAVHQVSFIPTEELAAVNRLVLAAVWAVAVFLSLIFGSIAGGEWESLLRFLNSTPFGKTDPIFGRDIGFYVFQLPVYRFLQSWFIGAGILIILGVGALYLFNFSLQGSAFVLTPSIKNHLAVLGAALLLLFSLGYVLDRYELLFGQRGAVFGMGFTDAHARLLALTALAAIAAISAALLFMNIFQRGLLLLAIGIGIWIAAAILLGSVYPAFVQRFDVEPNELDRERPYLEHNIRMTREAFGLDRIQEEEFPAADEVTPQEIASNSQTVLNIRLWDHRPLQDTYNQIQSIRLQYEFADVDVDRYNIDGIYRQIMVAARELDTERLPQAARTWVNERLQYTHGYGVAASPVNEISQEGLPNLFIKDVPPTGIVPITRPEIYFGEVANNYVIVNSLVEEFDFPRGDANVYTRYQGTGGLVLDNPLKRIAFALRFDDANIVLSGQLTPQSRMMFDRAIRVRTAKLAPFLLLDADPYVVISGGRLFWIQDAYTVSDRYPYSNPHQGQFNYIRNSVKVVVDAYNGTTDFYVADTSDPIIETMSRIFPKLFKPLEQMPTDLRSHVRYPEDLFNIQANKYMLYHMQDPRVFYNREDLYAWPTEIYLGAQQPMRAYYTIMRIPGESGEEFIQLLPFTPSNKNNTIAWLAGRSDGDRYGHLLAFKFPKDKLVYGPLQLESRIDQDSFIAQQITLWNQSGSRVLRGNLLMIPIGRSNLYVEPLYLQAEKSQIPELKRVIVATGNRIAMEPNLAQALDTLFKGGTTTATPPERGPATTPPQDLASWARQAQDAFNQAQDAARNGNWAGYGEALRRLQDALQQITQLTGR